MLLLPLYYILHCKVTRINTNTYLLNSCNSTPKDCYRRNDILHLSANSVNLENEFNNNSTKV